MAWEIEATDEFTGWYMSLDPEATGAINDAVDLLAEVGPTLGRPHVDHIKGSRVANLKELRTKVDERHLRMLFVFDPRRAAILLLGGDKTGRWAEWYRVNVPRAEELYRIYLQELREEGMIE